MAILRAQLLKWLFGHKVRASNAISRDLFIFTHLFKGFILVTPLKLYSDGSYRVSYRNYSTLFCSEKISLSYRHSFSRYIMAPKKKQPAATKVGLKKAKVWEILPLIIVIWCMTTYKQGILLAIVTLPIRRYCIRRIKLQALIIQEMWDLYLKINWMDL
jgi:hypothetical protein